MIMRTLLKKVKFFILWNKSIESLLNKYTRAIYSKALVKTLRWKHETDPPGEKPIYASKK